MRTTRRPARPALLILALCAMLAMLAPPMARAASADAPLVITTASGKHAFTIEWASTPDERERGLMYRKTMPKDHGMLFDFHDEQRVAFWMHNTYLPLDMLFIDGKGVVKRIEHNATPMSDTVIPSGARVRYVLEINGGLADAIGIAEGDAVTIPAR